MLFNRTLLLNRMFHNKHIAHSICSWSDTPLLVVITNCLKHFYFLLCFLLQYQFWLFVNS